MSNKTQVILVRDMPNRVRDGLSELGSDPSQDFDTENGAVISEVGPPVQKMLDAWSRKMLVYKLRQQRKYKLPGHIFGKTHLGDAFSAFTAIPFQAPAVGSKIILNPKVTAYQAEIMKLYKFAQADATWIIYTPAPLGTGIMLRVYAPEFDPSTETRGVRFRPMTASPIAVDLPWSNDLSVIPLDTGRVGQSGLSIVIETQEDNTVVEVGTPLQMVAFCCVHNIHLSGLISNRTEVEIPGLNFVPVPETPAVFWVEPERDEEEAEEIEYQSEVTADATNEVAEGIAMETGNTGNLSTNVEGAAPPPTKPKADTSAAKNQTGVQNATWFPFQSFTVSQADVGVWKTIDYNPSADRKKGEAISLPYNRNVWVSGSRHKGYVTTISMKIAIPRAPQISGLVEFVDSANTSSRTLVAFGETKEIELIPINYAETPNRPVRYANNPWLLTNEARTRLRYRVLAINRNGDIADMNVTLMVRAGSAIFQAPKKPRRQAGREYGFFINAIDEMFDCIELHADSEEHQEGFSNLMARLAIADDNDNPTDFITPLAGDKGEAGENNESSGLDETFDQDDFGVEVWRGTIRVGEETAIPLNLSAISDSWGDGLENTITQKFQRFAHIQPKMKGTFGPCIGRYMIKVRVPATEAGDIQHVLLPNDMNTEVAVTVFGLSTILSMASSALQPVGGALITGAMNAGRNILGKVLGGLLGGSDSSSKSEKNNNPSDTPNIFGGGFDLSRFMNFLKPVVQNEILDPTMATLLVAAKDFFSAITGRALTEIPISVIIRMDEHTVERTVYNRTYDPVAAMPNQVWIPKDRYSYIADCFVAHPKTFVLGSKQNIWFTKFMLTIEDHVRTGTQDISICINEIAAKEYSYFDANRYMLIKSDKFYQPPIEWETQSEGVSGEEAENTFL